LTSALSVFRDMEKLLPRHIPSSLPHRELHISMLRGLFVEFLERPGETYERVVQLYGPVGSGKTSTAYRFGMNYQKEASTRGIPLRFLHVNCKLEGGSRFILYQTLLQKLAPELATRGHSPGEMLRLLVHHLRVEGRYLLLALDDVDYLVRRSKEEDREGGVVYDLTRVGELHLGEYQNLVGVIFIARDPSFLDLLDPSERSSLGNIVVRLQGYDSRQLRDILAARVEEAFRPGAVDDEIIGYVADLAARKEENAGDCRFALDIMLTSGLIADAEGARAVSMEHVRRAVGEEYWGLSSEDLLNLDEQGAAILTGAVQALQHRRTPYVSIKEVYDFYLVSCEAQGLRSLSYSGVLERVKDLALRGIVDYREDRGLSIAGASLEDLSRLLRGLERRRALV
jgi:cell division control protein 6